MTTIIRALAAVLVLLAIGSTVQPSEAGGNHRMRVGLATSTACSIGSSGYPGIYWHGDSNSPSGAHDFHYKSGGGCSGSNSSSYQNVYFWSRHVSGSAIKFTVVSSSGLCTSVRVRAQDATTGQELGHYMMTHISQGLSTGTIFYAAANNGWSYRYAGSVLNPDSGPSGNCPWTGPHLHQSGDNSATTAIYRNSSLPVTLDDPSNYSTQFIHLYSW